MKNINNRRWNYRLK